MEDFLYELIRYLNVGLSVVGLFFSCRIFYRFWLTRKNFYNGRRKTYNILLTTFFTFSVYFFLSLLVYINSLLLPEGFFDVNALARIRTLVVAVGLINLILYYERVDKNT